ncbi:MAG: hypothetical protein KDL87_06210 [Verrucomicrobiae bacterium]|nr:hypothetical protein [Verrucomicrobiae bacterium]
MKIPSFAIALCFLAGSAFAQQAATNEKCPICGGKPNPKCTTEYEGVTYAFRSGECKAKFETARAESLYQKLGGKAAINAAVDLFYKKMLADERVKHFFDDVNMSRQANKQKAFLSAALGGPIPWEGKDMRTAHKNLPDLNESHFNAVAENLQTTLEELKVDKTLIDQVMAVVASTKDDVLNRPKKAE